jgi:hypothetical protein
MKTKNFLIAILLILLLFNKISIITAQNSFEFLLNSHKDETIFSVIENNESNYVLIGSIHNTFNYTSSNAIIIIIDNQGELINSNEIFIQDSLLYLEGVVQKANNNYLCFGRIKTSDSDIHELYVCELDQNLSFIQSRKFKLPENKILNMELPYINSSDQIILYGSIDEITEKALLQDYFFFKISKELDSIQMVIKDESVERQIHVFSILENPTGYFAYVKSYAQSSKSQILTLDDTFTILSYKDIPEAIFGYGHMKAATDSTYYIGGMKTQQGKNQNDDIACVLLDSSHTDIYALEYFGKSDTSDIPGQLTCFDFIEKNTVYFAGTHDFKYGGPPTMLPYHNYLYVIQTDSMLNIKRELFYGGNAAYYVWSVLATSDGGCIISANKFDHETQEDERDALILKLDSYLNLPVSIEEPKLNACELILYPNPGNDKLFIRTAVQSLNGDFMLYDISGKLVRQQIINDRYTELNTTDLPNGTYVYKYILNGQIIESGKWVRSE